MVEASSAESIVYEDHQVALLALTNAFGPGNISWREQGRAWKSLKGMMSVDTVEKTNAKRAALLNGVWEKVRGIICKEHLKHNQGKTQTPDSCIVAANEVGKLLGIDVKAMFTDISKQKGFTEPKSWKKLAADEAAAKTKKRKCSD